MSSSRIGSYDPSNLGQYQGPPLPLPPKKKKKTSHTQPPTSSRQQQRLYPVLSGTGHFPPMVTCPVQNVMHTSGMAYNGGTNPMAAVVFSNHQDTIGTTAAMPVASSQHQQQQQHHMATSQSCNSSNGDSSNFFKGWELRSGKWLKEEEAYAELLIRMFDRGQLSDCVTGSTMRAYLAQKLHCAPMRISKKFAGKGIGKKVYCCRIVAGSHVSPEVIEQRRKMETIVEEAKKVFQDAACTDAPNMQIAASIMSNGYMQLMTSPSGMQFSMPAMAAARHFYPQMAQTNFLNPNQAVGFFSNCQGLPPLSVTANAATIVPTPTPAPFTSAMQPPLAAPPSTFQQAAQQQDQQQQQQAAPTKSSSSTAQQLQQSYMSAVANHPLNTKAPPPKNHPPANGDDATSSVDGSLQRRWGSKTCAENDADTQGTARLEHPGADPDLPHHVWPSRSNQGEAHTNGDTTGGAQTSTKTAQVPSITNHGAPLGMGFNPSKPSGSVHLTTGTSINASASSSNFRDFAADFDKVALSLIPERTSAPQTDEQQELQCSPPFTSRSFDDFHRLLGKDISPLDDGTADATTTKSPRPTKCVIKSIEEKSSPEKVLLDSSALFTAESYAMFAQESALAASQHAAYLAQDQNTLHPSGNRHFGSFDFDSTIRLIHQHVPVGPRSNTVPPASSVSKMDAKPQAFMKPFFPFQPNCEEKDHRTTTDTQQTKAPINDTPIVSSSEPTSSANESSVRGTTSESNGSDSSFSNSDDGHSDSVDDSDFSDDSFSYEDAPGSLDKRKKEINDSQSISSCHFDESGIHNGVAENNNHALSGDLNGGQ